MLSSFLAHECWFWPRTVQEGHQTRQADLASANPPALAAGGSDTVTEMCPVL